MKKKTIIGEVINEGPLFNYDELKLNDDPKKSLEKTDHEIADRIRSWNSDLREGRTLCSNSQKEMCLACSDYLISGDNRRISNRKSTNPYNNFIFETKPIGE